MVDKDTRLKYSESVLMIGFGLWFALLLLGSLLPDKDISETGRMWLLILTMTYGVLVVAAMFWTGYSRKQREWLDANPEARKQRIRWLPYSWLFYFVFMFGYHLLIGDEPWQDALFQSLLFASSMTVFNYFYEIRRAKKNP